MNEKKKKRMEKNKEKKDKPETPLEQVLVFTCSLSVHVTVMYLKALNKSKTTMKINSTQKSALHFTRNEDKTN